MKNRRSILILLFLVLISSTSFSQTTWNKGDVNHDNHTNIVDALLIAQYYVGIRVSELDTTLGDINCDMHLNIIDALLIAQFYVGIIKELEPCDTPTPTESPTPTPTATAVSPTPDANRSPNPTPEEKHVSILPVFVVPSDQTHLVPDPYNPEIALDGNALGSYNISTTIAGQNTYYGSYKDFFNRAKQNFSAHLQTAQLKYEIMIEESTGKNMGTFRISTWNDKYFVSEIFEQEIHGQINPYLYISRFNSKEINDQLYSSPPQYSIISEMLDQLELNRENCPYIFYTIFLFDPTPGSPYAGKPGAGGRPLNYGFNGGGYIQGSYSGIRNSHIPGTHAQSTIIHEMGHAFGMPHVWAYMTSEESSQYGDAACGNIPASCINFSKYCSTSIMSYNQNNWIEGGILNSLPEGEGQGRENNYFIIFEDTPYFRERLKELPGKLVAENIEQLGRNDVCFPDLDYNSDLYPGYSVRIHNGFGDTTLPVLEKVYSEEGYMFQYEDDGETIMRPQWSRDKAIAHGKSRYASGEKNIQCAYDDTKMGYELFWNQERVGFEPSWSRSQSVNNLIWNKERYPSRYVEGFFEGKHLGYQLFHDGKRISFEPDWTKVQAIEDLLLNKELYHPDIYIEGVFEGIPVGYELFWDGERAGYAPEWSYQSSVSNCIWNIENHPGKYVQGRFEGKQVGYELFINGISTDVQPDWTKEQAADDYQNAKELHHPEKLVEAYFDGIPIGYQLFHNGVRVGFDPHWTLTRAQGNLLQNINGYPEKKVTGIYEGNHLFEIE